MKIAIVGTGVSGLVAAHHLARDHDLTLFEAADYVGGHVHTHAVELEGRQYQVDSGFIVFNERNYPGFVGLIDELGVESDESSMSFSVQCERTGLEYNGTSLNTLFSQRRNLLRPSFYRMIREVLRFNEQATELLEGADPQLTIGEYLDRNRYSREFIDHYILPMGASIWSSQPEFLRRFPAGPFVHFFHNHGMLAVNDRPTWRVIRGGSRRYVEALIRPFEDRIRLRTPVHGIRRRSHGVDIRTQDGVHAFDEVVLAVHSDQALRMLEDASPAEQQVLGAIPYQENEAVLHTDRRLLPRSRRAWASWNYYIPRVGQPRVAITYDMNILQNLDSDQHFCVTLNRSDDVDPDRVLKRMTYQHPQYTPESFTARARWEAISGTRHTHFCGAYWGYGFHEDGVQSALRMVRTMQPIATRPAPVQVSS